MNLTEQDPWFLPHIEISGKRITQAACTRLRPGHINIATQQGVYKEGPQVSLIQPTSLLASQGSVSDDQSHWGSEVSQGQAPDQTQLHQPHWQEPVQRGSNLRPQTPSPWAPALPPPPWAMSVPALPLYSGCLPSTRCHFRKRSSRKTETIWDSEHFFLERLSVLWRLCLNAQIRHSLKPN